MAFVDGIGSDLSSDLLEPRNIFSDYEDEGDDEVLENQDTDHSDGGTSSKTWSSQGHLDRKSIPASANGKSKSAAAARSRQNHKFNDRRSSDDAEDSNRRGHNGKYSDLDLDNDDDHR